MEGELYANLIEEWLGPLTVDAVDIDRSLLFVRDVSIGPESHWIFSGEKVLYP